MSLKWFVRLKSLVVLSTILIVIGGCQAGKQNTSSNASNKNEGEKVLTIANGTDIESFDVHNNNNTVSESVLVNVFDYLLRNEGDKKVPVLATSWKQLNDTTWEFNLRKNVTFQNGDPFTADDVKFTLERVAKDNSLKQNSYFKNIKEVQVVNKHKVKIITDGPDPLLLNQLSKMGAGILPAAYIKENGMDAFLKNPIGTGPYKLSRWLKDNRVELVKNKDYFNGTPKWDKVVFRAIPEATTRVSELLTGGIDIAANVPATDVDRIEGKEGMSVAKEPTQRVLQLIVRQTKGTPTENPKVREAIDLAIDKKGIVDSIAGGAGILTRTSVTPGNFGAEASLYKTSLYDPKKAKQLLKEAGYKNPEISLSASSQYKEYVEVVASMLTEVGFKVKVDVLEPSAFSEKMSSKSFGELYMVGIGNSLNDASNNYNRYLYEEAKGETDYNNPKVEKLLQAALKNLDTKSREQQYQQVQKIFAEDRPAIYLFQMKGVYGVGNNIQFTPRKDEMYYVDEISLKN